MRSAYSRRDDPLPCARPAPGLRSQTVPAIVGAHVRPAATAAGPPALDRVRRPRLDAAAARDLCGPVRMPWLDVALDAPDGRPAVAGFTGPSGGFPGAGKKRAAFR